MAMELLLPTCLALFGFTIVIVTKDFTGYSELVINRGAGLARIVRIVLFQALTLMSQMLPFAVLIGTLVGLGRLANDLEILVLSALGIEPRRLIVPVAFFGVSAATVALILTIVVAPWAHRGLDQAFLEISEINPAAEIQPGVVSRFEDWKLEAREISSTGQVLERVVLWIPSIGETVFATTAEVEATPEGELEVALHHGALLLNGESSVRSIRFEEMRATLPRASDFDQLSLEDRLAGMSFTDLLAEIRNPPGDQEGRDARSELHRRGVLPVSAGLFAALAVPLALGRQRASRSDGAMRGLAVTVAYYGLVQLVEGITQRAPELVILAAWLPNAVLLLTVLVLNRRLARPWPVEDSFILSEFLRRLSALARRGSNRIVQARRWALPRYVSGRFLQLALLCFAVIVSAYLLVDILERLQWFARHAATPGEFLRFYSMRIPLLVSRVIPMGLLVAMALTISQLTLQGELVGMRSCGISASQALRPALLVCLVMTPVSFLLNDQIVPRTNELADLIKQRDIKEIDTKRSAVWGAHGRTVYQLASLDKSLGAADGIVVYQLGSDGLPKSRTDAGPALYAGDGKWRLWDASAVEVSEDGKPQRIAPDLHAGLGDVPTDALDLKSFSVAEVRELIREFSSAGDSTINFEVALHMKLATPLACLLLPALIMIFAVAGPPFPSSALTLVFSGALAVGYTLTAGAFASFGRAGVFPPWLGGWAPILIASASLGWMAWRNRIAQREGD